MGLGGKTAVVTGGGSGIGRGICLRLARDGADVAVWDVNLPAARQVADEIRARGRRATAVEVDVSCRERVQAAATQVHEEIGPVLVLVNNAGISGFVPLMSMTDEIWDRMLAVHLTGTFNCTQALLPDMIAAGWGRIVNIASGAGLSGGPGLTHYASAKAGMIGFAKALTHEVGPLGITVNAVAPGIIDTPGLRGSGFPEKVLDAVVQGQPVRRIGTAEDVAAACAFLVSEDAAFVSGQVLCPNGGGHM